MEVELEGDALEGDVRVCENHYDVIRRCLIVQSDGHEYPEDDPKTVLPDGGQIEDVIERVQDRVRWWYAETFGEHPRCQCGEKAQMFLSSEGYRCGMCYIRGQPYQGIGYVRDLRPDDHFGDRSHDTEGDRNGE